VSLDRRVQRTGGRSEAQRSDEVGAGKRTLTEQIQRRGEPGQSSDGDVHAAAAHGTSGPSTTLPHLAPIQQLFGRHDVSGVQAHVGGAAAEGAQAMGASAFATGDRVAFAQAPDLHTAAHEAAHAVQQRAGVQLKGGVGEAGDSYEHHADAVADLIVQGKSAESTLDTMAGGAAGSAGVQRKIVVGGKDYDPKPDLPEVKKKYGKDMVEALTTMHNGGKAPPEFTYATKEELMTELSLRNNATKGMGKANANGGNLHYATAADDPEGHLDPKFWDKKGFYQFTLKAGAKPADAVRSIFDNKDNVLECNSTMVAIEYRSMLETMGDTKFNTKFAGGGLIISPHHVAMPDGGAHPFHDQGMIDTVTIASSKDLIPGDWIYFKNIADYGSKHPGGFWTGEHTMYLGDGKFQGFGTVVSTEAEINQKLLDNYNTGLPAAQQKKLADVPGLQNYARRPVANKMVK
jgi:Protein-glutamine gamma-glutamyltransferase/Domain of unknown function (DUF4157)